MSRAFTFGMASFFAVGIVASGWAQAGEAPVQARKFVEAQYGARKMTPFIEQRVEASVRRGEDVNRVIAAVRAQLPQFYSDAASAVSPLLGADQMAKLADFAASNAGRKVALADLRWAEEVRDQAEVCLEDGAERLRSVATDKPHAISLAARLVLGDCTVMREARKELSASITPSQLQQARVYVDAGGVRTETIRALASPAADSAARALIAANVAPKSERKALAAAVLNAVATDNAHWQNAAALHYAAAFRSDDLKKLAAFVTSESGAGFLAAKPQIDAAIAKTAETWFSDSIQLAIRESGTLATNAASAAVSPSIGPLPDLSPRLAIKPDNQPVLVMKPE